MTSPRQASYGEVSSRRDEHKGGAPVAPSWPSALDPPSGLPAELRTLVRERLGYHAVARQRR
jgi:hypothetical protein